MSGLENEKRVLGFLKSGILIGAFSVSMSCQSNDDGKPEANAHVIGFTSEKCGCCWGWTIAMGSDTIKTESAEFFDGVGLPIQAPIPVRVVLGDKTQDCSRSTDTLNNKDYYKIRSLTFIK